ncbi:hypothetical protein BY996DRAFT_6412348 [Phakopsora pachyrhizi]|nr:hypothetical protein BY996DRAFT_6412348 [Phakopsora pachyrhizi]
MYESDTPMAASDLMLQTCCCEGIIFALIVKACKPHKEQVVKVKNVLNRAESKVWIDEALIEHRRSMISSVRNVAESNGHPASRYYLLILPSDLSRKLKHKSRLAVYDKAFWANLNLYCDCVSSKISKLELNISCVEIILFNSFTIHMESQNGNLSIEVNDKTRTSQKSSPHPSPNHTSIVPIHSSHFFHLRNISSCLGPRAGRVDSMLGVTVRQTTNSNPHV